MCSTAYSLLPKCENEGINLHNMNDENSQNIESNLTDSKEVFKTTRVATNVNEKSFFQPFDLITLNKTAFQIRRAHKQPAIEKHEMIELEEKLKRTENNIIRLQNLSSHDETLDQLSPEEVSACLQGSSYNMAETSEQKNCHESPKIMPVFIRKKNDKLRSRVIHKTQTNKTKIPDENEYDSLSILMDDRRFRRTTVREKRSRSSGGIGIDGDGGGFSPRLPKLEPTASDTSVSLERPPTRSSTYGILPPPTWTPPSLSPQISQETLENVLEESSLKSTSSKGELRLNTMDSAGLSEIEARPTSRVSGVVRFVQAAIEPTDGHGHAKWSSTNGQFSVAYVDVIRGVMIQDKRATRALKACVKDMKKLEEEMAGIEIVDEYSGALREQLIQRRNRVGYGLGPNFIQDALWNIKSPRGKQTDLNASVNTMDKAVINKTQNENDSVLSLKNAKTNLLEMYGKSGVSTRTLRKFGERTRWK